LSHCACKLDRDYSKVTQVRKFYPAWTGVMDTDILESIDMQDNITSNKCAKPHSWLQAWLSVLWHVYLGN